MNILAQLYDEFAPEYERTRVPRFRPFVKRLMQLYDTRPGSHVLDAGCGTGIVATTVAPRAGHGGKVLGVDASAAMLEIAREKARGYGFDQCEFALGDILHLDAPDDSFDLVVCSFALWGEPRELFAEFLRVLRPHGALLVQNWESERGGIARVYNESLRAFRTEAPDARLIQVRELFSKQNVEWQEIQSPQDYERVMRETGFSAVSTQWCAISTQFKTVDECIEFHDLGVKARAEIAAMDESTRARFHQAVRDVLQPMEDEHGISTEWRAIQVSARK